MAVVTTSRGQLEGVEQGNIKVFRGVPFARPPVGELRFAAPQAPDAWDGVRPAREFGRVSLQLVNPGLESVLPSGDPEPQDEDCLYLNVWTPGLDGARRPVMVWIHGGGFTMGSGSSPMYDGTALATRGDVVVVTVNYRLGALGFLTLPEAAGAAPRANFGMLDQVAALRWVRDEIARFGGDPDNVTIFGESAGGMSVGALLGSPLARGLFRRAIPQSGAGHNALTPAKAAETTARFSEALGVAAADVAALRAVPAQKLLDAQAAVEAGMMEALAEGLPPQMGFQPVIDGHFLTERPLDAVARGASRDVSLLIGTTAEEAKLFTAMSPAPPPDDAQLARAFAARLGLAADAPEVGQAIDTYRRARSARGQDATNAELFQAFDTDFMFRVPADRLASAHAAQQPQTYAYRFDWRSPAAGGALGACHALEIPFVFGTHVRHGVRGFAGSGPDADALAERVMDAWLAFARTGDPSTPALPWPAYETKARTTVLLDRECRAEDSPAEPERLVWEGRR